MSVLRVHGDVERPGHFSVDDLRALPEQIADVGAIVAGRAGAGVRLRTVLAAVGARGAFLKLSSSDGFSISVPRAAVDEGVLALVGPDKGGPVRLLLPDAAKCGGVEIDACANVKALSDIEVTAVLAPDTHRH